MIQKIKNFYKNICGWLILRMMPTRLDISVTNEKIFQIALSRYVMCGLEQFKDNEVLQITLRFAKKDSAGPKFLEGNMRMVVSSASGALIINRN